LERLQWDLLSDVASWPDPAGLAPLGATPSEAAPSSERRRAVVSLAGTVLDRDLLPPDPDEALGVDAEGRLHLRLSRRDLSGSASAESHPQRGFPVLTLAFKTGQRAASSIAELRQQVADVLNDELRAELSREACSLDPHEGLPNAGLAQLDQETGYGAQFPFLYAYSGRGTLLLVFQELPREEEGE
jgi:hypothetical protein